MKAAEMLPSLDTAHIGMAIEENLPILYRALGYGDGTRLRDWRIREALANEYTMFTRILKKL